MPYKLGDQEFTDDVLKEALESFENQKKWKQKLEKRGEELNALKKELSDRQAQIENAIRQQQQQPQQPPPYIQPWQQTTTVPNRTWAGDQTQTYPSQNPFAPQSLFDETDPNTRFLAQQLAQTQQAIAKIEQLVNQQHQRFSPIFEQIETERQKQRKVEEFEKIRKEAEYIASNVGIDDPNKIFLWSMSHPAEAAGMTFQQIASKILEEQNTEGQRPEGQPGETPPDGRPTVPEQAPAQPTIIGGTGGVPATPGNEEEDIEIGTDESVDETLNMIAGGESAV